MRGMINFGTFAACLVAGIFETEWYTVAIIAFVYATALTITNLGKGAYWFQAFAVWALGGFAVGFIPYFIGKFIGSF